MVDTTINYNPNTQETKLFNDKNYDKNYEILSVRKAAEIFSTVSKGNIDKDLKKSCNDDKEKSGLYDFFYPAFSFFFLFFSFYFPLI